MELLFDGSTLTKSKRDRLHFIVMSERTTDRPTIVLPSYFVSKLSPVQWEIPRKRQMANMLTMSYHRRRVKLDVI